MRSRAAILPLVTLGSGLALLVDAAIRGTAHVAIVLIVPVLYGSSPEFAIGTLLAFLGLFGVLFAGAGFELEDTPERDGSVGARSGGVVLIGPIPIFFGGWKEMGRRTFWRWVAVGAIATGLVVLLALGLYFRG